MINIKEDEKLSVLNHSCAHLLAQAVKHLYPNAKFWVGPVIEDGFYYDIDLGDEVIKEEDLDKIEKEMKKISKDGKRIYREEISKSEALKKFKDDPYKIDLISRMDENNTIISMYTQGDFTDLCRGPHVESVKEIKYFKLLKVSGAYWKNDANNKMLQRIYGICFDTEEKPVLRALPLIPFEICEWSYHHKVGPNSHIWFDKGQYSVPSEYINKSVDVKYNNSMVYIYFSHKLIGSHKRLPSGLKNAKRTDASHLPYPVYVPETVQSTMEKAGKIGKSVSTVVNRLYDNAKVKEQALLDVKSILAISSIYGEEILEEACRQALKDYHMITYNTVIPYVKKISKNEKNNKNALENRHSQNVGIVRGADYYKKGGK